MFYISSLSGSLDNPKKWKNTKRSSDEEDDHPSCRIEHEKNQDNFWFFYLGGDFEFSNGEITEDDTCMSAPCCSDLANLRGSWTIETDLDIGKFMLGNYLTVEVNERKGENETEFTALTSSEILFRGKLISLTNENMEWELTDGVETAIFEFTVSSP
ncbi:MAG: hypothetical protein AAF519_09440 [Bacteroidota bacterium]